MVKAVCLNNTLHIDGHLYILDYVKKERQNNYSEYFEQVFPDIQPIVPHLKIKFNNCQHTYHYVECSTFNISTCPWLSWAPIAQANRKTVYLLQVKDGTDLKDPDLEVFFDAEIKASTKKEEAEKEIVAIHPQVIDIE